MKFTLLILLIASIVAACMASASAAGHAMGTTTENPSHVDNERVFIPRHHGKAKKSRSHHRGEHVVAGHPE